MMLHPAIGSNRWCGPGALAILTGKTTDETARLLRDVSGKRAIMRIADRHMLVAMSKLGLRWDIQGPQRGTLRNFTGSGPAIYLIVITGHYVVVDTSTMEVCDNRTVYPVPLAKYSQANKHVKEAWRMI